MKCRSCADNNLELILDLGDQPWGNDYKSINNYTECEKYPLRLFFCNTCALAQIDFTVPKEVMFVSHTYLSGTTHTLKSHFQKISRDILKYLNTENLIVDIGGNDGTFLEFFHLLGYRTLNIDSGIQQSQVSKNKGIETINDFFSTSLVKRIISEHGKATLVHASGILFHLEDLHDAFNAISNLLDKKGIMVAEFIYLPEMIKNLSYDQIYHEHLVYYSLTSFQNLLSKFDLEVFDCFFETIHGGTCVAYVAHKGYRVKSNRLKIFLRQESLGKVNSVIRLLEFAQQSRNSRDQLRNLVETLVGAKQTIYAIGAPVKGSTLINFAKLNEAHIKYALEKNPLKFNTYLPGTKIEVIDESLSDVPNVYLLLAWNFQNEIISKYRNNGKNTSKFILPVPYPKEI
jgi:hypothetical protein